MFHRKHIVFYSIKTWNQYTTKICIFLTQPTLNSTHIWPHKIQLLPFRHKRAAIFYPFVYFFESNRISRRIDVSAEACATTKSPKATDSRSQHDFFPIICRGEQRQVGEMSRIQKKRWCLKVNGANMATRVCCRLHCRFVCLLVTCLFWGGLMCY